MTIKVIVLDAGQLPPGVEFPPLKIAKFGWEQYPTLSSDDIIDRCWRADIIVSLASAIDRRILEKLHRVKLLITSGNACSRVDEAAAREQGVEILAFQEAKYSEQAAAQDVCNRISQAIDHYLQNNKLLSGH